MKIKVCIVALLISNCMFGMEHDIENSGVPNGDRIERNRSRSDSDFTKKNSIPSSSLHDSGSFQYSGSAEDLSKSKPIPLAKLRAFVSLSKPKNSSSSTQLSPERAAAQAIYSENKEKIVKTSSDKGKSKKAEKKESKRDSEKIEMMAKFMAEHKECKELVSNRSGESSDRTQG